MKRTILTFVILIAACGFVFGQSKDEREIRKMFEMSAAALVKNDMSALSNYYTDDLTFTVADGKTYNKTQFLDFVKNTKRESFNFSDLSVRPFGNTAVVLARPTYPIKFANGQIITVSDRATMTLQKTNGRWQIVATHSTWDNPETGDFRI